MGNYKGYLYVAIFLFFAGVIFLAGYSVAEGTGYARCSFDCVSMFEELCDYKQPGALMNLSRWINEEHSTDQDRPFR